MSAPVVFHLIPHTHWDREWYLPRAAFGARLVAALDDLIGRLESQPAFATFLLDGQTVLLEDYLAIRPEQARRVRNLVAAGRLQTGPWYVLADEIIPSAESLVRNLLIGAAQSARLGRRSEALYSPDAFGHPAAWPSLGSEFGITRGAIWRGLGGLLDLVRWRAPDGAEILVYHLPPAGYEVGAALPAEPESLARAWPQVRDLLVARAATRHVAVFVGADHHAAHPAIVRLRTSLAALEPRSNVLVSRLDTFLAAADRELGPAHPVSGELRSSPGYTWTLQGVHSTRAPMKRRAARAELWLERMAEPLSALARRAGGRARGPLLTAAWRELVQCHFHDAIAGCSADSVAAEVEVRLTSVAGLAREIVRDALHELAGYDPDLARDRDLPPAPALVLWNPAPRPREAVVIADLSFFRRDILVGPPGDRTAGSGPGYSPFSLIGSDGAVVPVQVLGRRSVLERIDAPRHYPDLDEVDSVRIAFRSPVLAGLSLARMTLTAAGPPPETGVELVGGTMRNERIEATLERDGSLSVTDRQTGASYHGLLTLESDPDAGDTYTFCPTEGASGRRVGPVRLRALARGPLVAELESVSSFARVEVRLRVSLRSGEPFVRCVIDLDNSARHRRLRMRIPVGIRAATATAGTAFGTIARPVELPLDAPSETAVRTSPAHRAVAAAGDGRGLVVFAPGFFEYEWTGSDLLFTLLRSVGELSRGDLPTRPGHAGWATPTPAAQCLGPDRIEIALGPVTAAELAQPDRLMERWEDAMLPTRGAWLRDSPGADFVSPSIDLTGDGLVFSAVKPAEDGDGMVLRCWNARDVAVDGAWRVRPEPASAERTRADERPGERLPIERGGLVRFRAAARQIASVRIR